MKTQARRFRSGFTIIELMVVISTIGLISTVAIQMFLKFGWRAKRTERDTVIMSISRVVREQIDSNPLPPSPTGPVSVLITDWNPPLPVSGSARPWDKTVLGWNEISFQPESTMRYSFQVFAVYADNGPVLTVTAVGDVDADGLQSTRQLTWTKTRDIWNVVDVESGDDF